MKKPKLSRYIVSACIIAFIIFIIVNAAFIYIVDKKHTDESLRLYKQMEDGIERTVREQLVSSDPNMLRKEMLQSEEYGTGIAAVDFVIKVYSSPGLVSKLYDSEGNVICDSGQAVFFKVYKKSGINGSNEEVIRLETEYNDEWREIFEAVNDAADHEKIGSNDLGLPEDITFGEFMDGSTNPDDSFDISDISMESRIIVDEIYVKGGYFVPGKVHVRLSLSSVKKDGSSFELFKDVVDKDMTPEDISDYTKITMSGDDNGNDTGLYYHDYDSPAAWGISDTDEGMAKYDYVMECIEKDDFSITKMINHSSLSEGGEFDKEFLHHFFWDARTVDINRDIEGPEYVLMSVSDESIFTSYYSGVDGKDKLIKRVWIPAGILGLLIFLVMGSFIGGLRYMKAKSVYDMKCYRIETTNAMAHDLKTPLTAISGYAENLLLHVQVDKREYYAKAILTNIEYMDQMIHDILELSKSEDERQTVIFENVKLAELVKEELDNFIHVMEDRGLSVLVSGEYSLKTDKKMMKSLIDNLLSNAVKYAKEGSEISIVIRDRVAAGLESPVQSRGMTITNKISEPIEKSPEELVKPYVKGDNSRGSMKGSGVGLAIVENVARKLKYKVSYDITDDEFKVSLKV